MSNGTKESVRTPLIEAKNLKRYFDIPRKGKLHAVDNISFKIYPGETLGLVGESGCGKSTVGNVIMRLLKATDGELLYKGENVFDANKAEKREYSKKMQIIFQDPYSSLNPKKTIKSVLSEAFKIHKLAETQEELDRKVNEVCDIVGISRDLLDHYPHELDGGMRQVVGIGRALSLNPDFIVCDEPVSSLDVSIQAKIINLLMDLQQRMNLSYLFISHDLSVVGHICNRIAVMYLGQIVELADRDTIFNNAKHPYTIALLSAIPRVNVDGKVARILLEGDVPSPMNPKPGCRFAQRCWMESPDCATKTPELVEVEPGHYVSCHYAHESRVKMLSAATTSISS